MTVSLIIILSAFAGGIVVATIVFCCSLYFERKEQKKSVTIQTLQLIEKANNERYAEHNWNTEGTIQDIVKSLGYSIKETSDLPAHAWAQTSDGKIIKTRVGCNAKIRNFLLAHELGHILTGSQGQCESYSPFKVRAASEQKQDYVALALLLPKEYVEKKIEDSEYYKAKPRKKRDILNSIADEKGIGVELVKMRLDILELLNKNKQS